MIWHLNLVPPFLEDPDTIPQHTKESNFLPYLVIFRSSHPKNRHLQLKVYRIVLFSCQSDILQAIQQTLSTASFSQDKIYFLFGLRAHLDPQRWDKLPKTSQKMELLQYFFGSWDELEPGFWSTSCWKYEQQICVVRLIIAVNLKVPKNLSSKSCGNNLSVLSDHALFFEV